MIGKAEWREVEYEVIAVANNLGSAGHHIHVSEWQAAVTKIEEAQARLEGIKAAVQGFIAIDGSKGPLVPI